MGQHPHRAHRRTFCSSRTSSARLRFSACRRYSSEGGAPVQASRRCSRSALSAAAVGGGGGGVCWLPGSPRQLALLPARCAWAMQAPQELAHQRDAAVVRQAPSLPSRSRVLADLDVSWQTRSSGRCRKSGSEVKLVPVQLSLQMHRLWPPGHSSLAFQLGCQSPVISEVAHRPRGGWRGPNLRPLAWPGQVGLPGARGRWRCCMTALIAAPAACVARRRRPPPLARRRRRHR